MPVEEEILPKNQFNYTMIRQALQIAREKKGDAWVLDRVTEEIALLSTKEAHANALLTSVNETLTASRL